METRRYGSISGIKMPQQDISFMTRKQNSKLTVSKQNEEAFTVVCSTVLETEHVFYFAK